MSELLRKIGHWIYTLFCAAAYLVHAAPFWVWVIGFILILIAYLLFGPGGF